MIQHLDERIIEVRSLRKYYDVEEGFLKKVVGHIKAVDDVSFSIDQGKTLGIVGESGSGKSTLGKAILRGIEPSSGEIIFKFDENPAQNIVPMKSKDLKKGGFRRNTQMIFQDPFSSLDPRMSVMDIISEPLVLNKIAKGKELQQMVKGLMKTVGLDEKYLRRYPHAFSGGQRQRISIARALSTNPKFLVADEPTSALDVSIQAQILNLMRDLQKEFNLTYLFISHNLGVIRHVSDDVAVMYLGKIVEIGPNQSFFSNPLHPYSNALLKSVPVANPRIASGLEAAPGEIGNQMNLPSGCSFHPRCKYADQKCREETPKLKEIIPGHQAACHYADNWK